MLSRATTIVLGFLWVVPLAAQAPLEPRTKGSADAPVTIYEMSDFQCPYCEQFTRETFPSIERDYIKTGKIRWIFINFPLTSLHPNALPAAEFAMCAARQGKFWVAHDMLYAKQDEWAGMADVGSYLTGHIAGLGLDRAKMLSCVQSPDIQRDVKLDAEGAVRSGARSTPSFYIEGAMLTGAQPMSVFKPILDSIVAAKRKP